MEEQISSSEKSKSKNPLKKLWQYFSSQSIRIKVVLVILLIAILLLPIFMIFNSDKNANGKVSTQAPSSTSSNSGSSTSDSTYAVEGNKIVNQNGNQFVPYGFVLECLGRNDKNNLCQPTNTDPNTDSDKIKAIASFWHGNTVRLQVAQENLFQQSPYDANFLSMVDNEVNLANNLGIVAIITLQEEEYKGPPFPTQSAVTFWQFMANHYKNNPRVFFDLYNEPQLTINEAGSESSMWNIWQSGGTVNIPGKGNETFVGMQELVNTIRGQGANNIIIAEGNLYDRDLAQLPTHYLTGSNIAYGVEPNLYKNSRTPQQWYTNFGQYAKSVPLMPEAFRDNQGNTCDPNSPTDVPTLFSYLTSIHMGAIVWTLAPGISTTGTSLTSPTSYAGLTTVQCTQSLASISSSNTVGPGQDILSLFEANGIGTGSVSNVSIFPTNPISNPRKGKHRLRNRNY